MHERAFAAGRAPRPPGPVRGGGGRPGRQVAGFPGVSIRRDDGGVRVLVTGDRGSVGVPVAGFLRRCGYAVAGFDRADGADVLDLAAVRLAARDCAAIVHMAALAHDSAGSPEQIMAGGSGYRGRAVASRWE